MRRSLAVLAALVGAACGLGIHEPTGPCGEDAHAGPTPQQLAFVSDARFGQFDICLINVDGTAVAQLTTSLGNDSWPAWKPDGTRLAFQSYRTLTPVGGKPQADIFVINVDGTGETQLTTDTTNEAQPAWSPDGTKIAFVTDRDGNNEIYVMNADGTSVRRLTNNAAADEQPAWSPDGGKIAFVSDRTGNPDIFVMDSTGANPVDLTNHPAVDVGPAWSPDSLKIAFHSDRPGNFALFVMNADGTNATQLTDASVGDELPAWSPDGTHLVYDTDGELWVIRPDGSEPRQVTHSRYVQSFMARWRP
ncbi:MAG: hypothetical protein DMD29_06140 [Gemmatimonadetes bacterium]|nr:MAG: hypothetical protein DMD29_06140 [Gemmatimonadota bacterium]